MRLKDRKVLVTGACGFIGSHLVEYLLKEGCKVKCFVFYNSFNSWGWLDTFSKGKLKALEIIAGDVRDPNAVRKAVKGTDIVFHLAALIGIPFSYNSVDSYVDTNIKGTLNVLQASREYGIKRVVVTSTSEVYGTAKYTPIDENHPLQGQSPYSASKIGADKLAESFYLSFGLPVIIARPFNTFGPRQSARAVIPTIISQVLAGSKEIKLGNIAPTRDFTYVDDTCSGLLALAGSQIAVGKAVNICSGREISIGKLAELIRDIMGSDKKIKKDKFRIRPKSSEVERLLGDNRLIRRLTGWKPQNKLEDGLIQTINWFSEEGNRGFYKAGVYNI